jgi:hypothetical protein
MSDKITGYDLSRAWFDFCFENPEKIKPIHTAIYFFSIEHCNRLGWKEKFGLPTSMVLDAIGLKSYASYKKHFDDIVEFGFLKVHEYSKNQYSSNIVALTLNNKANVKALDKALIKHTSKQHESTGESNYTIDKQETKNNKQINNGLISIYDLEIPDAWKVEIKNIWLIGDRQIGYEIVDFQEWYSKKTNSNRTHLYWKDKLWEWIDRNNPKKSINPFAS